MPAANSPNSHEAAPVQPSALPATPQLHRASRNPNSRRTRRPAPAYLGPLPFPRVFWAALLIAGLTLFTFGGTLGHLFVFWDDNGLLFENPDFNPPTSAALAKFWADPLHGYRDLYVPVSYSVWWAAAHVARVPADRPFHGIMTMPNPVVFHGLNLAFHTAGAVVVFLLLRRLVRRDLPALFGAAVFALHPLQADPVNWVSSMYTPLSGLLALSALLLYLRASDARERRGGVGEWGVGNVAHRGSDASSEASPPHALRPHIPTSFLLATLCYVLALLTKPTILLLPAVVAAIEVGLRGRRWRDCRPLLMWLGIGVLDALITRHTQLAGDVYVPPIWQRPLVAADALAFYLFKLVLPFGLTPDYGRSPKWVLSHSAIVAFTWLLPAAVAAVCWWCRKKAPWVWVGAAVFLAGVLPTIGLTPFDYQFYSTVADRYVYFSMLGPALVVAFLVRRMTAPETRATSECTGAVADTPLAASQTRAATDEPGLRSQRPAIPASIVCEAASGGTQARQPLPLLRPGLIVLECTLLLLAVLSRAQTGYWTDTRTLFGHTLDVNPDSLIAHRQLGFVMLIGNDPDETESAIDHYRASLRIYPEDAGAWSNLGLLLSRQRRPAEAAEAFRRALALRPREAPIHLNLANALAAVGDADGARLHYRAALAARPNWPQALTGLERLGAAVPAAPQNASVDPRESH